MGIYVRGEQWWGRHKGQRFPLEVPVGPMLREMKDLATRTFAKKVVELTDGVNFKERKQSQRHTLGELIERFMADHGNKLAAATLMYQVKDGKVFGYAARLYENSLTPMTKLTSITPEKVQDYKNARLQAGMSAAGLNRELAFLRQVWNHGIKPMKWCGYPNPVTEVGLEGGEVERTRYLSDAEEIRLRKACGEMWDQYEALMTTGLRRSELVRLRWPDVDLKRRTLTVKKSKSGKPRTIPLDAGAVAVFARLTRSLKTDLVFYSKAHAALKGDNITKPMQQFILEAGIEDFTPHDLRHTYATRKVQGETDLYKVQILLGHSDPKMTQRYAHHCVESLRDERESTISAQSQASN